MVHIHNVGLVCPVELVPGQLFQIILQWGTDQEFLVGCVHLQIYVVRFDELDITELDPIVQMLFFYEDGILQHGIGSKALSHIIKVPVRILFVIVEIGQGYLNGSVQVLLLKGFYQITIWFHRLRIFHCGPIGVGGHKYERDVVGLPDVLSKVYPSLVRCQDDIDQHQIHMVVLQHVNGLLVHNHIVHDFIADFLKHGLHIICYDDIVLYDQNSNWMFQAP